MRIKKCKQCLNKYEPKTSLQSFCKPKCYFNYEKQKKKTKHLRMRKQSGLENDRLRRKADALFQQIGKTFYPKSILSGDQTEVIHHRIKKSESNYCRYYLPNGVPLTSKEHDSIHSRGKSVELDIDAKMGEDWCNDLREKRKIICKLTDAYLEEVIDKLKSML